MIWERLVFIVVLGFFLSYFYFTYYYIFLSAEGDKQEVICYIEVEKISMWLYLIFPFFAVFIGSFMLAKSLNIQKSVKGHEIETGRENFKRPKKLSRRIEENEYKLTGRKKIKERLKGLRKKEKKKELEKE